MAAHETDLAALDPADYATRSFGTGFRGFDQDEVRAFLRSVGSLVADLKSERAELQRALAAADSKVASINDLDEDQLTAALGEETARVLATARHSATEIRSKAEENVARLLRESTEEAAATRAAAEDAAAASLAETDAYALEVRGRADTEVAELRAEADAYALATRTAADEAATAARTAAEARAAEVTAEAEQAAQTARREADAYAATARTEADAYASTTRQSADEAAAAIRAGASEEASAVALAAESSSSELLAAAAKAAEATVADADAAAEQALAAAEAAAAELRAEAEGLHALRTAEAESAAAEIRAAAEELGASARVDAEALIAAAKDEGRELVAEAQRVRERMLKDLARRRKTARQQVEQLRAARERLLEAYAVVRRTTDEATSELLVALPEARVAALDAGRRIEAEAEATVAELETEIDAAREAGLLTVGPEPVSEPLSGDAADLEAVLGPMAAEDLAGSDDEVEADEVDPDAETTEIPVVAVDPAAENPVLEEPAAEEPVADEPAAEEPVAEEPVAEDPVAEELVAEEPVVEEPPAIEPAVEEPVAEEPIVDSTPIDLTTPVPDGEGPAGGAEEEVLGEEAAKVDDLFARLRESRTPPRRREQRNEALTASAVATLETESAEAAAPVVEETDGVPVAVGLVTLLERRDGATQELERNLGRRLKRVLADEQNEVLDVVRRARGIPSPDEVLPAEADHVATYAQIAIEDLGAAMAAGAEFEGAEPGTATLAVDDLATALGLEMVGLIRPRIARCFEEVEGDEDELTALIRSCYREWKTQRINDLTQHHVLIAFGRGQFEQMPEGTRLQWVIDDSGPPCPDAEDNALTGLVAKGEPFATGHCMSPAHPGCRCLVVAARH